MKIVAIVQARMGSTRLPGKVLLPLRDKPMLELITERVKATKKIDEVVVATSTNERDDAIAELIRSLRDVSLFRGSENDVLDRYYSAAKSFEADVILRVTADNPFFHAEIASSLIALLLNGYDYVSNNLVRTFPYGIDLEAFWFSTLERAHREAGDPHQREHVTPYIRENPMLFRLGNLNSDEDLSEVRLTVDTQEDYARAALLFAELGDHVEFEAVVEWLRTSH